MAHQKNFEDQLINNDNLLEQPIEAQNLPAALQPAKKVVNKQMPDDWRKQQDAAAVVKKLKDEKREREKKLAEIQKLKDEKISKEVEERQRVMREKQENEMLAKQRKKAETEQKVQERIQNRQRSIGDMVQRTKAITSAKTKPMDYYFIQKEDRKTAQQLEPKDLMKPHSLRYEEIIRKNKEDLRRKRSLNHMEEEHMSAVDAIKLAPSFKSRLHSDVRQQNKLNKDQSARELNEKLQK